MPIGAYLIALGLDVLGVIGRKKDWGIEYYHAATFVLIGGLVVSVFAALTGFWDWWKSSEAGTQARRTINAHAWIMITTTVLVIVDIALRLGDNYQRGCATPVAFVLTVLVMTGRVYVGAHNPLDVTAGFGAGLVMGGIVAAIVGRS